MEIVTSVVEWFLIKSIYGGVIASILVYSLTTLLVAKLPGAAGAKLGRVLPIGAAAVVFLPFMILGLSYERIKFERETQAGIASNGALRVVGTTNWGSFVEPYTLVTGCCIGFFDLATPDPMTDGNFSDKPTAFQRYGIRFDEEPIVQIHVVQCKDREYQLSMPDKSGTFRIHDYSASLSDEDYELYCKSDWSEEMAALREQAGL